MLRSAVAEAEGAKLNVVLAGNPNAGKTTLFNALTGSRLRTGNYHGVTTSAFSRTIGGVTYTDVPGMYSFNAYTMEEGEAYASIRSADVIVNVADALTLPASLALTQRLIALGKPTLVVLSKCGELRKRGGYVDMSALSALLGVPVAEADAKTVRDMLDGGIPLPRGGRGEGLLFRSEKDKNAALEGIYSGGNALPGRLEKALLHPVIAPCAFVLILLAAFFVTFFPSMPGALISGACERLICVTLSDALTSHMTNPALISLVRDGILGGVGGVLAFIPQIALLYLVLIALDESGVSSALSFVTDGLFEKVGLSGKAAFSLVSGLGCTAAAISTTRGFSLRRSRLKTIAVLPYIPCGAKLPVFVTLLSPLFKDPFPAVCVLYFGGILLAIALSALIKGGGEGLIAEVAPISLPKFSVVLKKLSFQLQSFIIKVMTYVLVFCLVSWVLSHYNFGGYCDPGDSLLAALSRVVLPLFRPMGISDWRYAYALISGFAAKENVAATLEMLLPSGIFLTPAATAALCTFVLTCPACISAFASSVRELGFAATLKLNALQLGGAFIAAYAAYFAFSLI